MAKELVAGNHHTEREVSQQERQIARDWQKLIDLLARRQQVLHGFTDLMGMFREIESVTAEMKEIEVNRVKQTIPLSSWLYSLLCC